MKIFFIIFFILFCPKTALFSQDNLSGNYYTEYHYLLKIEKNSFKLIIPRPMEYGDSDTLANGIIKQIDKSLIELNTNEIPFVRVSRSMKIIQKKSRILMIV